MKPRHGLLGLSLVGAAALLLWGDATPDNGIAEPVLRPAQTGAARPQMRSAAASAATALPRLRPRGGTSAPAPGQEASLFASTDWAPPPPPPPAPVAPPPPGEPKAPAMPFTVLGKAYADGQWQVFLARGNQTYVVTTHSLLDNTYRVDAIEPPLLRLTYLPLNQAQQIHIGSFN